MVKAGQDYHDYQDVTFCQTISEPSVSIQQLHSTTANAQKAWSVHRQQDRATMPMTRAR